MTEPRKFEIMRVGGMIDVSSRCAGVAKLSSSRYECEGCRRRTLELFKSVSAIASAELSEIITLTVTYDPNVIDIRQVADLARDALQADPHNSAPVALVFADVISTN